MHHHLSIPNPDLFLLRIEENIIPNLSYAFHEVNYARGMCERRKLIREKITLETLFMYEGVAFDV